MENWRNVSDSIYSFAISKIQASYFEIAIIPGKFEFDTARYFMNLSVEDSTITDKTTQIVDKPRILSVLPGPQHVYFGLYMKDSLDIYGYNATYRWQSEWPEIKEGSKEIIIGVNQGDSLTLEIR